MPIKLIGVDGSSRSGSQLTTLPVINPSDFRGEAYQIQSRANQTANEIQRAILNNQSATIAAQERARLEQLQRETQRVSVIDDDVQQERVSSRRSGGGGGKEFNPLLDVSEREKFEYEKLKDQQSLARKDREFEYGVGKDARSENLNVAKFQEDVARDRRDYAFKVDSELYDRNKDKIKSASEMQYAMAQQDVEEATVQLQTALRSGGGMSQVRDIVTKILAKYPNLDGNAKRDLIKQAYQPAQEVTKEQISTTQNKIKEVQGFNRQTMLQKQRIGVQGLMVKLQTATGASRETLLKQVDKQLESIATDPEIDPVDKAFIISKLTEEAVQNGEGGAELADTLVRYDSYTNEAAALHAQRSSISPQEYAYRESRLRNKYGLASKNVATFEDPNYNTKKILESERLLKEVRDMRVNNQLDAQYGLNAERGVIGQLAKSYATPGGVEALRAAAQRAGNPPGMLSAVKVAQDLIDFRTESVETQRKMDEFNKEIAMLQASTATSLLSMLQSGRDDVTAMAFFQNLSPEMQRVFGERKKLTPEQQQQFVSQYTEARQRAIEFAQRQRDSLGTQLNIKRQQLEIYVGKDQFAAADAVRQQKATPNLNPKSTLGVSPKRGTSNANSQSEWANSALQQLRNMEQK